MDELVAGRYRLGERIGSGGSARVHRAVDELLDRPVAIKLLDADALATTNPTGRGRFLAEAQTAASFLHPNAVTVFDAGEDAGDLFMVMELVEGTTLARRLAAQEGPMTLDECAAVLDQVLAALDAAHHEGVVHRDVTPANVLVGTDGTVKLADFGIAKRFDQLGATLTAPGVVLGTPRYLAPEQASRSGIGPAADVYAVGVVAFELLTGSAPFTGATPCELVRAHRTRPVPDLTTRRPGVPPAVARVVATALAKDPSDRFADAGAMRAALAEAWDEAARVDRDPTRIPTRAEAAAADPAPGSRRELSPLALALVFVAFLVVGWTIVFQRGSEAPAFEEQVLGGDDQVVATEE